MPLKRFFKSKQQQQGEGQQEQQGEQEQQQEQQQRKQEPAMALITDAPPTTWTEEELAAGRTQYSSDESYELSFSKQNPTPGKCQQHERQIPSILRIQQVL
jgi:hypothetical protein